MERKTEKEIKSRGLSDMSLQDVLKDMSTEEADILMKSLCMAEEMQLDIQNEFETMALFPACL